MRYLRSIYLHKGILRNKTEHLEFAPVTIFCGGEQNARSEMLKDIWGNMFGVIRRYEDFLWEQSFDNRIGGDEDENNKVYAEFNKSVGWITEFDENFRVYDAAKDTVYDGEFDDDWLAYEENVVFETDDNDIPVFPLNTLIKQYIPIHSKYIYKNFYEDEFWEDDKFEEENEFDLAGIDFRDYHLCFLDMPEFGLSVDEIQELVEDIEECARLFSVQFVIATESPIIASVKEAIIYDMDDDIVKSKEWKDVGIVKKYYEFFNDRLNNKEEVILCRNYLNQNEKS